MILGFIEIFKGLTFDSPGDKIFTSRLSECEAASFWANIASSSACFLANALASRISRRIASAFSSL
jgi:hypothetical protein